MNHFCRVPCVIQQSGSLVGTSSWFEVEKERDRLSILEKLIFSFTCFFHFTSVDFKKKPPQKNPGSRCRHPSRTSENRSCRYLKRRDLTCFFLHYINLMIAPSDVWGPHCWAISIFSCCEPKCHPQTHHFMAAIDKESPVKRFMAARIQHSYENQLGLSSLIYIHIYIYLPVIFHDDLIIQ